MQYQVAGWIAAVVAVVSGCASRAPYGEDVANFYTTSQNTKTYRPADKPRTGGPFASAAYEVHGDIEGFETITVVAVDSCGVWVEDRLVTAEHAQTWLLCMNARPSTREPFELIRMAYHSLDGAPPERVTMSPPSEQTKQRLRGFEGWLYPAQQVDGPTEDVQVLGGTFVDAKQITVNATVTTWIHPAVPFGGVVKMTHGTRTYALRELRFTDPRESGVRRLYGRIRRAEEELTWRPRWFLGGGLSLGWSSATESRGSGSVAGWSLLLGRRIGRAAAVAFETESTGPDDGPDEGRLALVLRWTIATGHPPRLYQHARAPELYVLARAAYVSLAHSDDAHTSIADGGELALGIGGIVYVGREVATNVEFAVHGVALDHDEGAHAWVGATLRWAFDFNYPL